MKADYSTKHLASQSERLIWYSSKRHPDNYCYTLSYVFNTTKKTSEKKIQQAMFSLLNHELHNLNMRFFTQSGKLYKKYIAPSTTPVIVIDGHHQIEKPCLISPLVAQFEFYWRPLVHGGELIIHLSHLVFDGACYTDLVKAISRAFGKNPPLPIQHINKSAISNNEANTEFWKNLVSKHTLYQPLPYLSHNGTKSYICATLSVDDQLNSALKNLKKSTQVTHFQIMTAALTLVLYRYLQKDGEALTLSLAYYASLRKKTDPIGCYTTLLPLFVTCADDLTCMALLMQIKKIRRTQKLNQNISTEQLLEFDTTDHNHHHELFNVVINESEGLLPSSIPKRFTTSCSMNNRSLNRTLTLIYQYDNNGLHIKLESNAGTSLQAMLDGFATNFKKALAFIISSTHQSINQFVLCSTDIPVSKGRTTAVTELALVDCLTHQQINNPEKIAIRYRDDCINYRQLEAIVYQLANAILSHDHQSLQHGIGLFLSRSCQLPAALVACIKAGICFIPLPPDLPKQTIQQIIKTTNLKLILTDNNTDENFSAISQNIPHINIHHFEDMPPGPIQPITPLQQKLAYIIFTSGSTGVPKGVQVSYKNLTNFLESMRQTPGFINEDIMLALTSIGFDIAINELLLPLYTGATVIVADHQDQKDGAKIIELINKNQISVAQLTPSTATMLIHAGNSIDAECRFWIGGENLQPRIAQYFIDQGCLVYNMYGPTEATIWASSHLINHSHQISIGGAVNNCEFHIVDRKGRPLPFGIPGELVIAGYPVAMGYMNADMSAFIKNTFRTGDKVVALSPNNIKFIERIDSQVKLRGHRIEISEIEHLLHQRYEKVLFAVVVRDTPTPDLHCFYSLANEDDFNPKAALRFLSGTLASYKVPSNMHRINQMPINRNGKVDKKSLAEKPLSTFNIILKNKPSPTSRHEVHAVIKNMQALIENTFSISVDDPKRSLIEFGFNSISFNQLSSLFAKALNINIKPHQFYSHHSLEKIYKWHVGHHKDNNAIEKTAKTSEEKYEKIAIIGFDALLPGCRDAEEFWEKLVNHDDMVVSHQRFQADPRDRLGALNDLTGFDRQFFKLSPLEVMQMDPRQRLLLECAYKTLEHAGWSKNRLANETVACYIGASGQDYLLSQIRANHRPKAHTLSGNALNMLANRLSYYFNWSGPSMVVDTACSSSLAALARAIDTLHLQKADVCFVAAANLVLDYHTTESLQQGGFLSEQYRCASFSEDANGYVRGEGVIGYLIKPLSKALAAGDHIHGVIESISENHGGQSASLTAPNQKAQTNLMMNAYNTHQRKHLSYIETHGTGTKLGDPIEIEALLQFEKAALLENIHDKIFLGALKSNIGHLESCAGFASMLKVIMAMKYRCLPANLHNAKLNSLFNLNQSKFTLVNKNQTWDHQEGLLAGISSFGFGGSNAHVVLTNFEEKTKQNFEKNTSKKVLFILSANDKTGIITRAKQLIKDIQAMHNTVRIQDIAYTLMMGRVLLSEHIIFDANHLDELTEKLSLIIDGKNLPAPEELSDHHQKIIDDYLKGHTEHLAKLFNDNVSIVPLTPYQFINTPYWYNKQNIGLISEKNHNLLSKITFNLNKDNKIAIMIPSQHVFFSEHKVFGIPVLPGVAQIECVLKAFNLLYQKVDDIGFENVYWLNPITRTKKQTIVLNCELTQIQKNRFKFLLSSSVIHCQGELVTHGVILPEQNLITIDRLLLDHTYSTWHAPQIYSIFNTTGIEYGKYFQGLNHVKVIDDSAKSEITLNPLGSMVGLLDAAFQSGMAISLPQIKQGLMPFSLGMIHFKSISQLRSAPQCYVYTKKLSDYRTHLLIVDTQGQRLLELIDLGVKPSTLKQEKSKNDVLINI